MDVDVAIFGGGVAGLWLLDDLVRHGFHAILIETGKLGQGQTIASQGIIHGGFKYTLQGVWSKSAESIADLPDHWRRCLNGTRQPDLRQTRLRAEQCYLWRTDSWSARLGMFGARLGLKVAPQILAKHQRPDVLVGCPGQVAVIDEPVLSPGSLIEALSAPHRNRIFRVAPHDGCRFKLAQPGSVESLDLIHPENGETLTVHPQNVVFTAGAGNSGLRTQVGLSHERMQRRPLHMAVLRGKLPPLNGHCIEGGHTRVTITSDRTADGETIWQLGGQLAEQGVALAPHELLQHAAHELSAVLPGIDLSGVSGTTYRVDRAEGLTDDGKRPDGVQVLKEGNVFTAWPTKLVLAPRLAAEIRNQLFSMMNHGEQFNDERRRSNGDLQLPDWPRPEIAVPPWEEHVEWEALTEYSSQPRSRRSAA